MTMRAIVSFAALLGLLGLTPRPSAAKSCEDLLVGNSYSCTVTSQGGVDKSRATGGPQTLCVSFDDRDPGNPVRDGLLDILVAGSTDLVPCACGAKGRLTNPKFGEGPDVTCINPDDGAVLMAKATKKGLKKGFVFNAATGTDQLFECKLDPTCVPGCGLEGDTCGGSCPDGSTCVNTGQDVPTCECMDTALTCEATAACDAGAYCPGVYDTCGTNPDTGACQCTALTPLAN